jgi:hypothetical protein
MQKPSVGVEANQTQQANGGDNVNGHVDRQDEGAKDPQTKYKTLAKFVADRGEDESDEGNNKRRRQTGPKLPLSPQRMMEECRLVRLKPVTRQVSLNCDGVGKGAQGLAGIADLIDAIAVDALYAIWR